MKNTKISAAGRRKKEGSFMRTHVKKTLSALLSPVMALSLFGGLTFTASAKTVLTEPLIGVDFEECPSSEYNNYEAWDVDTNLDDDKWGFGESTPPGMGYGDFISVKVNGITVWNNTQNNRWSSETIEINPSDSVPIAFSASCNGGKGVAVDNVKLVAVTEQTVTLPTAKEGLICTGFPQALVNAGATEKIADKSSVVIPKLAADHPGAPAPQNNKDGPTCPLDGRHHGAMFWGIVRLFFHTLIYFFRTISGRARQWRTLPAIT